MSLLSVVVPTRDTKELTLRCLESLVGAGQGKLEIVVVDDGSQDETGEELERRFPDVRLVRHESARGFSRSANSGLGAATGETLLLLNSDTEVPPGGLDELERALKTEPRLGIAGASLVYPDGNPQWSGGREPGLLWLFGVASGIPALLSRLPGYRRVHSVGATAGGEVDWVSGAAMGMRREVWEEIGPLDESFEHYAQDLDFCLRARSRGWRVAVIEGFQVMHHHGATIGHNPSDGDTRLRIELLCRDLLRWARKHRGPAWARRAAVTVRSGLALRGVGRWMRLDSGG